MTDPNQDLLRDHEYDGIREYDNPTPRWWSAIFFGTFLFSIWYFLFFHTSTMSTSVETGYQEAVSSDVKQRFAAVGELTADEATMLRLLASKDSLTVGATVFKTHCVSCHGADGAGLVGPNLTDDHYKNVRTITDIAAVVENGAADGAMPAWKSRLHSNEVVLVATYTASLRGKNIAGPRGPEGEVIPPWPVGTGAGSS